MRDRDAALACVRAYNDFHMDVWVAAAPSRFIGLVVAPLWDPAAAAAEIGRNADRGARAVIFPPNPENVGLPPLIDDAHWKPILAAVEDAGLVACIHPGGDVPVHMTGTRLFWGDRPRPANAGVMMMTGGVQRDFMLVEPTSNWVLSGVFRRHPRLRLALSEGGISWIPQVMARLNHVWRSSGRLALRAGAVDLGDDFDAYELVGTNLFGCLLNDWGGLRDIDRMGPHAEDAIMIETDYPHADTVWPHSLDVARSHLAELGRDLRQKILWQNATRLFHLERGASSVGTR
jgi:predicted TIM-barrel fold metal-dependent hydrolase